MTGRIVSNASNTSDSCPRTAAQCSSVRRNGAGAEAALTAPRKGQGQRAVADEGAVGGEGFFVGSVQSSGISVTDGATVSLGLAPATSRQLVGDFGGPEPRQKAKRKVQTPIALDDSPPAVSGKAQRSVTRKDYPGAGAAAVDHPSHPDRKRTILSRYVFGDALKPGERWKRRLSKGR